LDLLPEKGSGLENSCTYAALIHETKQPNSNEVNISKATNNYTML